jgi:hypothetical protein
MHRQKQRFLEAVARKRLPENKKEINGPIYLDSMDKRSN